MNASTTQELVAKFTDVIDEVTGVAVRGGRNAWELMLEKQSIDAFLHGLEFVFILIALGLSLYGIYWVWHYEDRGFRDPTKPIVGTFSVLSVIVFTILVFVVLETLVLELFLPEYAAIEEIINKASKL